MLLMTNESKKVKGNGFFNIPVKDQIFHKLKKEEEEEVNEIAKKILEKLKQEKK